MDRFIGTNQHDANLLGTLVVVMEWCGSQLERESEMPTAKTSSPLGDLYNALKRGEVSRRSFVERSTLLGVGGAAAIFMANTAQAAAQHASPEASPAASPTSAATGTIPEINTENQVRGSGPELRIIQWQGPTLLNPATATGVKDYLGGCIVLEPLMHYLPDTTVAPNLVTQVPSVENGQLAADLTTVTLTLVPGVLWSDGEPFTAEDVKFTWEWTMNEENPAVNIGTFETISSIEVVDELTAQVTFSAPNPLWFAPFTGTSTGFVLPKHVLEAGGQEVNDSFASKPIGTGPYVVETFVPNDQVVYAVNENYRHPNKPFFSKVNLKGGGDAVSAARTVLQTGEYDYAWNLQVEPDVLGSLVSDDGPGAIGVRPTVNVERIDINQSDPNQEVDGQRSEKNTPHPFFSDPVVRQALTLAIDRDLIQQRFYGEGHKPGRNVITGVPETESPNTVYELNPDKANQLLDEAGWAKDGDVRSKDGIELSVQYATSINSVRQKTQAVVKQNLEAIGFKVELVQVDAGFYFDSAPANDQNINHFYWDLEMYQQVPESPRPLSFLEAFWSGENGDNIAQKSNDWAGQNYTRWSNEEYDQVFEASRTEIDDEVLVQNIIKMNDLVINNYVICPLVQVIGITGVSRKLNLENLALAAFSYDYWNIANWNFNL
jgi:peptide/nickel transport system substrate-binding protein